jgi:hypothetical protein
MLIEKILKAACNKSDGGIFDRNNHAFSKVSNCYVIIQAQADT